MLRNPSKFAASLVLGVCSLLVGTALVSGRPLQRETSGDTTLEPLPAEDRIRIAEAYRLFASVGERLWTGWSDAPRALLLVTPDREFLVHHPYPTDDFTRIGYDSLLASDIHTRERVYDKGLQATFPAVAGVPTVVIGQPKHTQASHSTRWVLTVLHEHFHQWQMSQPDYYAAAEALGLADKDTTGMWMLNYPFPYDSEPAGEAFRAMCLALHAAATGSGQLDAFLEAKQRFREQVSADDYRYYEFQLWQEGISRYTEIRLALQAGVAYRPTEVFRELDDYVPFAQVAREITEHAVGVLERVELEKAGRTAFYSVGATLGLLLDDKAPGWRNRYLENWFSTDALFEAAR